MKKTDALEMLCNGEQNVSKAARLLGVSRHTVSRWPDDLPLPVADQVRGCYMRITEERDREAVAVFGKTA